MADAVWPDFSFSPNEHLTSNKLNNLLIAINNLVNTGGGITMVNDVGPFTVSSFTPNLSKYTAVSTGMYLQLGHDPLDVGGIEFNNDTPTGFKFLPGQKETIRRFKFEYTDTTTTGYWKWEDLQFFYLKDGATYRWLAKLDDRTIKGYDNLDYTTLNLARIKCYKDWDSLPIWNGNKYVICFSTDDNNDENYGIYKYVFQDFNLYYTLYTNYETLGNSGKMTTGELLEMSDIGFEVGNHTRFHTPISNLEDPLARLWNPLIDDEFNSLLQLKADGGSNVQNNSFATAVSGEGVRVWADETASGYQFINGTTTRQPIFRTNQINNMPGIDFDGDQVTAGDALTGAFGNFIDSGSASFFILYDPHTADTTDRYIFDARVDGSNRLIIAHSRSFGSNIYVYDNTGNRNLGATVSGLQLLEIIMNVSDGTISGYRNGELIGSDSYSAIQIGGAASIGNQYSGGNTAAFNGIFYEILMLDEAPNSEKRKAIEGYMTHRHGKQGLLTSGHRYRYVAPNVNGFVALQEMHTEVYGNKTRLEHLINYGATNVWQFKDKKVKTLAYAGGGDYMYSDYYVSMLAEGHIGARLTGIDGTKPLFGKKGLAYSRPDWNRMNDPYAMGLVSSILSIVVNGDNAATKTNMFTLLDNIHSPPQGFENSMSHIYWHKDDADEYVTSGALVAMLEAVQEYNATSGGSIWVAPVGVALEYWLSAHPKVSETNYRSWY